MNFSKVKVFQVKPDKIESFEALLKEIAPLQKLQEGSVDIKYMQRFYTFDGASPHDGNPPRELTRIVRCVKYYSYWEFDNKENYGKATKWFFDNYYKQIEKLLIMPFDINCGNLITGHGD